MRKSIRKSPRTKIYNGKYNFEEINVDLRPKEAFLAAKRLRKKRRIKEIEEQIIKSPRHIIRYCNEILKDRWPEAEEALLKFGSSENICDYSLIVIKDRWAEAENKILKDVEAAYRYAVKVMQERWPEAEKVIIEYEIKELYSSKTFWGESVSLRYCEELIKEKWKEAEDIFEKNSELLLGYAQIIETKLPEKLHNKMLCYSLSDDESEVHNAKEYFDYIKEIDKKLIKQLKNFDSNLTIGQLLEELK
jgi:hypothetical protein